MSIIYVAKGKPEQFATKEEQAFMAVDGWSLSNDHLILFVLAK
jgi:hypothetical protein